MNKPSRKPIETKYRSPIMRAIHQTVEDLHAAGVVDKTMLRRFDEMCLPPVRQRANQRSKKVEFERGSGNVFADLGLANPKERQAKARLMYVVNSEIKRQRLTQTRAAEVTGLNQADVSRLARGRGLRISSDRLIDAIRRLGMDVELTVQHSEKRG